MALAKFQEFVVDGKGNVLVGASVNLYETGTTTEAQLYSDRAGTTTITQPILTDGNGQAEFYVVPGIYDLKAELGGISTTLTDYEIGAVTLIDDTVTDDARVWSSAKIDSAITVAVDAVEIFATQEADRAEAAADEAENARDAAQLTAGIYADTTAGLAATTDGEYFSVPSATSDEFLILYRNDAGVATEIDSYPNADAVRKRVIFVPDIAALRALTGVQDGQRASVTGYHPNSNIGGGEFYYDASRLKTDHNGGTVISPTVPWDGSPAALPNFLSGVGETDSGGTGVFVKKGVDASIDVSEFGGLGDNSLDNFAPFTACASIPVGKITVGPGTFRLSAPVDLLGYSLLGAGRSKTTIICSAPSDHMFSVGGLSRVSGVYFQGGGYATHGLEMRSSNGMDLSRVRIEGAKRNGVYVAPISNNNSAIISKNLIRNNGFSYSTGTASGGAGGTLVTFTGAADLTTLGFDQRYDYLYLADSANEFPFEIYDITANTISVYPALDADITDSTFVLVAGAGILIDRHSDSNVITIQSNSIQVNAAAGIQDYGLYGSKSEFNTFDNNRCARILGRRNGQNQYAVIGSAEIGNYYESSSEDALFYAYATGTNIILGHLGSSPNIHVNNSSQKKPLYIDSTPRSVFPVTGLEFPDEQTPVGNPNTLDGYKEAAFTPSVEGATTAGAATYTVRYANSTKIGNLVHFEINVLWTGHTGTGGIVVDGLPYPKGGGGSARAAVSIGYFDDIPLSASHVASAYLQGTRVVLQQYPVGGGPSTTIEIPASGHLIISGSYTA